MKKVAHFRTEYSVIQIGVQSSPPQALGGGPGGSQNLDCRQEHAGMTFRDNGHYILWRGTKAAILISVLVLFQVCLGVGSLHAFSLPDTGQIKCYDNSKVIPCPKAGEPFYGQDANYSGPKPSYRDNGNGTVTDLKTGLIWQQGDEQNTVTRSQSEAMQYCEDLDLAGKTDWRLPTLPELSSLVLVGRHWPAINEHYFPVENSAMFWSSSPMADAGWAGWIVSFVDGMLWVQTTSAPGSARCVREGLPVRVFVDNHDGTVRDSLTGLQWQRVHGGKNLSWEAALAYCEALDLAGRQDWRMPNHRELASVVDITRYYYAVDPIFSLDMTGGPTFWSSSSDDHDYALGNVWGVNFEFGGLSTPPIDGLDLVKKTEASHVLCVRGKASATSFGSITVAKTGAGTGRVTSSPSGIDCGNSCAQDFPIGTGVMLTAKADAGSIFTGWTGGGCPKTGKCVIKVDGDKTVSAAFTLKTYSISGHIQTWDGSSLPEVLVTLSGAATKTTTTNGKGNFRFSDLLNGSYSITAEKSGFLFSPCPYPVTLNGANTKLPTPILGFPLSAGTPAEQSSQMGKEE